MWGTTGVQSLGLLFLIYIDDIATVCNYMMPLLFADDTNLLSSGHDTSKAQQEVEADLNQISEWLKVNKMSLNKKKNTHFIVFTNRNASKPILDISIDGHMIDETDHTKFLGVVIDSKLTWKNHISYITGKIAKGIGVITRLESSQTKIHWLLYIIPSSTHICVAVIMYGKILISHT